MCGIIGIIGPQERTFEEVEGAIKALSSRGPDDRGISRFAGATLGHTRLAVIDLSDAGHQPMKDSASVRTIVFNGEIYNYKELRAELEVLGHHFSSRSDTEVILKAFTQWNMRCVDHLDGQFAFAIWDDEAKTLFLARDRFGEKPLYVARTDHGLIFGSEIKALLAAGASEEIDTVSIDNFLALGYVPPWRSIYKTIKPLLPAHTATWKDNIYVEERYWQLTREPLSLSLDDAAAQVRHLLTDSVRSRMIADIEVGAFLSGGIDSGIVVRLAQQVSGKKIRTFSGGFGDTINELPYAREIAALAGTEHTEAQMHEDLLQTFRETSAYFDEPFGDSSSIPTSLISKLARQKVKVALSGDGGDELFWGYGQYTRYNHLPKLRMLAHLISGSNAYEFYKSSLLTRFSVAERQALLKDQSAIETDPTTHVDYSQAATPLEKINLTDFYMGLPGDMLAKVDRASMMHSLEVRSPFLNHGLAQFAYNLPAEYKTDGRRGKIILEKAFGDLLPQGFFTRKKQGFGPPVGPWLNLPPMRKLVGQWLAESPMVGHYLNAEIVKGYADRFLAGEENLQYKVWDLLALEAWMRTRHA